MSLFRWWKRQCELAAIAVTLQAENEELRARLKQRSDALEAIAKSLEDGALIARRMLRCDA
jgi:cell division protein FtsB